MTYGSICSGIEAATVAWHPLGWKPAFFAEIEKFPSAVLAHHYPEVPNLGDFTKIQPSDADPIDLLVGGTPCQAFSLAGKRLGLDDPRGNLTLEWLALVQRLRPRWLAWENVPGVLSDDGGRTFGTVLGTLGQLGYRYAWRVLDAQYFGLAQRRKRVFLVGSLGDGPHPGAVLFEPESMSGHPAPSRETGHTIARSVTASTGGASAKEQQYTFVARDGQPLNGLSDVVACIGRYGGGFGDLSTVHPCLQASGGNDERGIRNGLVVATQRSIIRRLTPRECERIQGFPDDYSLIHYRNGKPAADGPRYKALGNSMAVPVMRWIGERIAFVDGLAGDSEG